MAIITGSPAPPGSCHARDSGFLPDPVCTRGDADSRVTPDTLSTTICRLGYTSTVRPPVSVTEPMRAYPEFPMKRYSPGVSTELHQESHHAYSSLGSR
jgi:hypothetical protein